MNPSGLYWTDGYVDFLNADGRSTEALGFALKNRDRDKKDIDNSTNLAFSYYYMYQPDKALVILDSAWLPFKHPNVLWIRAWLFIYLENINR